MKKKLRRTWRQVTADKKKFGILVTTVMVGLLLWGRLILLERVPKIATADPPANAAGQQADPAHPTPPGPAPELPVLPQVRTALGDRFAPDLFAFRHNRYRPIPPSDSPPINVEPVDPVVDVDIRRRELEAELDQLGLQSVIPGGPRPLVVINGRLLRVGDSIDGFEIVSFIDRSATLTRDGLTFILEMSTDR